MHATWRFLSFLTSIANRALALLLAVALLHDLLLVPDSAAASRSWIEAAAAWIAAHPRTSIGAAIALLLLELNVPQFLLFTLQNRPARSYIASRTPGGQSRIALAAIENALRATALQVPELARSRIRVLKLGAHRFRVHIRYWVRDVHDASNAAEHLRLVLKKRFSDLVVLDPKDRVEFDLDLAGIEGLMLRTPARKELPSPERGDTGFKGPVYPVEGDSSEG